MPRQQNKSSEPLPREQSEQGEPLSSISSIMPLEETGNTDFFYGSLFKDEIAIELDSDNEQASVEVANVEVINVTPVLSLQDILSELKQSMKTTFQNLISVERISGRAQKGV